MKSKKVSVPVGGKMVDAQIIEYETLQENWNEYALKDETILRIKTILTRVARTKEYDQENNPIYHYTTSAIASVIVPNSLKKKAG